jgi:hypothetical protein
MTQLKRWKSPGELKAHLKEAAALLKPARESSVSRKLIDLGTLVVGRTLNPP